MASGTTHFTPGQVWSRDQVVSDGALTSPNAAVRGNQQVVERAGGIPAHLMGTVAGSADTVSRRRARSSG